MSSLHPEPIQLAEWEAKYVLIRRWRLEFQHQLGEGWGNMEEVSAATMAGASFILKEQP